MKTSILNNPILRPIFCMIGRFGLFVLGWKTCGRVPKEKKFILIAAPHSSNWDFVIFLLIIFKFKMPVHWMGKASMFPFPFRYLLKRLGGIPIDRSKNSDTVGIMTRAFESTDQLIVTIAPSGTRSRVSQWKTGFYHIADQAGVPIVLGFVDYRTKQGGIGPTFHTTGDLALDMKTIRSFYKDKSGRY